MVSFRFGHPETGGHLCTLYENVGDLLVVDLHFELDNFPTSNMISSIYNE